MAISLQENLNKVQEAFEDKSQVIIKRFLVGFENPIEAALVYANSIADKDTKINCKLWSYDQKNVDN